jgi:hypothetical protein
LNLSVCWLAPLRFDASGELFVIHAARSGETSKGRTTKLPIKEKKENESGLRVTVVLCGRGAEQRPNSVSPPSRHQNCALFIFVGFLAEY